MWSGRIHEKAAYIQARSSMARTLEINGKARQAEGNGKVVWGKAPSSHENFEGSISSTLRTPNSKKPSRTRVRSWKHQWQKKTRENAVMVADESQKQMRGDR